MFLFYSAISQLSKNKVRPLLCSTFQLYVIGIVSVEVELLCDGRRIRAELYLARNNKELKSH